MQPSMSKLVDTMYTYLPEDKVTSEFIKHQDNEVVTQQGLRYALYQLFDLSRDSYTGRVKLYTQLTTNQSNLTSDPIPNNLEATPVPCSSKGTSKVWSLDIGKLQDADSSGMAVTSLGTSVISNSVSAGAPTITPPDSSQLYVLGYDSQRNEITTYSKLVTHLWKYFNNLLRTTGLEYNGVDDSGIPYYYITMENASEVRVSTDATTVATVCDGKLKWNIDNPNKLTPESEGITYYIDANRGDTGSITWSSVYTPPGSDSPTVRAFGSYSVDYLVNRVYDEGGLVEYAFPLPPVGQWSLTYPKVNLAKYLIYFKLITSDAIYIKTDWDFDYETDSEGHVVGAHIDFKINRDFRSTDDVALAVYTKNSNQLLASYDLMLGDWSANKTIRVDLSLFIEETS